MISWETAKQKAIDKLGNIGPQPERINLWHAYKNGRCVGTGPSKHYVETTYDTKVVENVFVNKEEIDKWVERARLIDITAYDYWYEALRKEYKNLSNIIFDICYTEACEHAHSSGYDEVAYMMESVVYFANKIIEASK
jgi:hypothetical protein